MIIDSDDISLRFRSTFYIQYVSVAWDDGQKIFDKILSCFSVATFTFFWNWHENWKQKNQNCNSF